MRFIQTKVKPIKKQDQEKVFEEQISLVLDDFTRYNINWDSNGGECNVMSEKVTWFKNTLVKKKAESMDDDILEL